MVDVSGIPNMGFGGGGYFGGSAALGQPAMSADQINAAMWGRYSPGAAQAVQNNIYGGGGFGAQPAYYAALGAAYGRQVAPSSPAAVAAYHGGGGGGGYPSGAVTRGADLSAPDTSGYDPLSQGTPQYDPWTGAITGYSGGGIGSDQAASARAQTDAFARQYRLPAANPSYFNPGTYAGDKNNYGLPFNPAGVPRPPTNGPYPNIGYNPSMQHQFANPAMNANQFQNRFGMGFPNAGTPSQYAPGAAMPPGFSGAYSADNPQGALPLGWNNSFNN